MRHQGIRFPLVLALFVLSLVSCQTPGPGRLTGQPASESATFVRSLGLGYNLGNTLEACGGTRGNQIANFEVAWGAPITTKVIFEDLKKRGFDTIRIPVAWSNLIADDYTIHPDLMNRVQEVTDMVIGSGMHAIVNIHWDGGWFADFPAEPQECMTKYKRIWAQIAQRFQNYDDRLMFESLNEEGCFDDVWNRYADPPGSPAKKRAFDILNTINQTFVDLVRGSGGRNGSRYLLIAGYATDIELTCSPEYRMPQDRANRSILSIHYYTPSTFTIIDKDASWGKSARTWGTPGDLAQLRANFDLLKVTFLDRGIPVVLGEYGTVTTNKEPESVRRYLTEVAKISWNLGICPVLWAGAEGLYDRRALAFSDPLIAEMYFALSKTPH